MYSDLNVVINSDGDPSKLIIGYETLGVNTILDTRSVQLKNLKIDTFTELIENNDKYKKLLREPSSSIKSDDPITLSTNVNKRKIPRILSRLTVIMSDEVIQTSFMGKFKQAISTYDLLSMQPNNEKQFRSLCSDIDIDIISLDVCEPLLFKIKPAQVNLAISRGIYFEICYSQVIEHLDALTNVVANLQSLIKATKGKNIIVGSKASDPIYTRPPRDIENLISVLFGINPICSKAALSYNCAEVQLRAELRRKSFMGVAHLENRY